MANENSIDYFEEALKANNELFIERVYENEDDDSRRKIKQRLDENLVLAQTKKELALMEKAQEETELVKNKRVVAKAQVAEAYTGIGVMILRAIKLFI